MEGANMSNKLYMSSLAVALLTSGVSFSGPVNAQESRAIDNIVVTAQKREESLQEVPVSISAFDVEALDNRDIDGFADLSQFTPGLVTYPAAANSNGFRIFMRGIGTGDPQHGLDSKVAMYVDGMYMGKIIGIAFDSPDLARAEVLKGPQGSLYGRNAVAGAINLISAKPNPDEYFGKIEAGFGSFGHNIRVTGKSDLFLGHNNSTHTSNITAKKFTSIANSAYYVEPATITKLAELQVNNIGGRLSVFHASSNTAPSGDNFTLDVRTEKGRLQIEGEDVDGVKLDFENSSGVGTAAIENNGSQNQVLKIRAHGTSSTLGEIRFETNSVEAVRIDENQRVGVGTISPGAMLDVVANSSTSRALDVQTNSGSLSITNSDAKGSKINFKFGTQNTTTASIENNGTENQFLVFRAQGTTSTDGNIRFITNGTDVVRIDENQNVGIGVTSPASKLEVDGGDIEIDDSARGLILRSPNGTRYRITVDNAGNLSTSTV